MSIPATVQAPSVGRLVVLFDLDLAPLGGEVLRFTNNVDAGGATVQWRGHIYVPAEFEADGFEWSGKGALPRPRLRVSNVNRVFSAAIVEFADLLGARVTRWRTFERYLDNGAEPDPDAHLQPDIYVVERKLAQNKVFVEFELAAAMDQQGRKLPGRQVLRGYCGHRYRRWDAAEGSFDYQQATCPYAEAAMFDRQGNVTADPAADACGKRLSDCRLRFGAAALPTLAFPGVARTRV